MSIEYKVVIQTEVYNNDKLEHTTKPCSSEKGTVGPDAGYDSHGVRLEARLLAQAIVKMANSIKESDSKYRNLFLTELRTALTHADTADSIAKAAVSEAVSK